MVEISVVVPTRDRSERLQALEAALAAQTLDDARYEVVIARDDEGTGPAATRNRGWQQAQGTLVAFTDDDCEPAPDWLERLLAAHRDSPEAVIQGRVSPIVRELDRLGPFGRTLVVDRPSIYFETANVAYPRALLERLGGFDERFPRPSGEDADLGWRAVEAGAERVWAGNAVVHHAVEDVGLGGYLRAAWRGPTSMPMMRRHPGLRDRAAFKRHFWHRNHALALLAVTGVLIGVLVTIAGSAFAGLIAAGVLSLPWLRTLAGRTGTTGGAIWHAPAHAAFDAVEMASALRHSVKARVLIV